MHTMSNTKAPEKYFSDLEQEFDSKIKYNFKVQVLLSLKGNHWDRQDVLQKIYHLKGYRCHKAVRYFRMNWSHLHIKFIDEVSAKNAVHFFNKYNTDFTAIIVDELLKDWYNHEKRSNLSPPWTLTIVDVVGIVPLSINLLSQYVLNEVLYDFGVPYLLPYTAALNETHVQVLFSSMTEALAACMAFGPWWTMNRKADQCFYRIRINPCQKEALLIQNSGGVPEEAFKLDYFVDPVHEINLSSYVPNEKQTESLDYSRSTQNQGQFVRSRCQKQRISYEKSKTRQSNSSQYKICTPILCIPVIGSYTQQFSQNNRLPSTVNGVNVRVTDIDDQECSNVASTQYGTQVDNIYEGPSKQLSAQKQILNPLAQTFDLPNQLDNVDATSVSSFAVQEDLNTPDPATNVQSYPLPNNQVLTSTLPIDPDDIGKQKNGAENNRTVESTVPDIKLRSSNHTYEYTRKFSKHKGPDYQVERKFKNSVSTAHSVTNTSQHSTKYKKKNFRMQPVRIEIQK